MFGGDLMNDNEKMIFHYIKEDPFISQQELSDKVGLSRSAVANIISGLVKKEYIKGKAYVVNDAPTIVCIGAANIDRKFYVGSDLIEGTSNPVETSKSVGGVARNIAENLGRLDEAVTFITACGDDNEWQMIKEATSPFVNVDQVHKIPNASTGSYTAVIDSSGSMIYGFADMAVYDAISPDLLMKNEQLLSRAGCIIVDLNIPKDSIEFLCSFSLKHDIKMVIVPVSGPKMKNLPEKLHNVEWIIVNKDETETFFNLDISTSDNLAQAAEMWNQYGVKNVIVTNGTESLVYAGQSGTKHYDIEESKLVVDVTGAGDAFSAAVIFASLSGMDIESSIHLGLINSRETVNTHYTVRHNLNKEILLNKLEERK